MQAIFQTVLYQPIFNLFVFLYNIIPDVGAAIILLTVLIKAILYPFTVSSVRAQKSLSDLQPKMNELKKKYPGKEQQQVLAQETMKLYKENKVNPFGSCLPLLIQIPIFLALYWVLQAGLTNNSFDLLYSFVHNPKSINPVSLGIFNLSTPNYVLAILAGLAQFWQARMMIRTHPPKAAGKGGKDEDMMSMMNKQMLYFMPVMTAVIGFKLPAGLALYWLVSTLLTGLQQVIIFRKKKPDSGTPGTIEGEIVK